MKPNNELLAFDLSEYKTRLEKVRDHMRKDGIDVFLITAQEDSYYLTGHPYGPPIRGICLIVPLEGRLTMIERLIEGGHIELILGKTIDRAQFWRDTAGMQDSRPTLYKMIVDVLTEQGLQNKRIGIQMESSTFTARNFEMLRNALPKATLMDTSDLVQRCRLIKSPMEIACVRRAARIASKGCAAGIDAIREGVSENQVAAAVLNAMLECPDYEFTRLPPLVTSGPRAAMAHTTWSGRILKEGDTVYLEIPASVNRYYAVTLRTVSVGPPSEKIRKVSDVINRALDAAIAAIKPGVKAGDVDRACRSIIQDAGYGEYFRHRTGYTLGIEWSQSHFINLVPGNSAELGPGMTFHIIPICMFFGEGAVGTSESILVTEEGVEVLTELDRKLYIR
jgi:Xaa-Pro dipeptidase